MSREYEENEEEDLILETTYRHYDSDEVYRSISSAYRKGATLSANDDNDNDDDDENNSHGDMSIHSKNNATMIKNQSVWNDPLINYELIYNEGEKKKETVVKMETEVPMPMSMPMPMAMPMPMPMPVRIEQQKQGTKTELQASEKVEEEEEVEFPFWSEGIDRFTNWIAKPNISPDSLLSFTKEVLDQLNDINLLDSDHNNSNNSDGDSNGAVNVLTYVCYNKNSLLCRIEIDSYRTCDFQIGIYRTQNGDCLFDVQELCGEHLTFSHFLHLFKSQLQQREIIQAATFTPDNYGLDMEINLESFDEL